MVNNVVGVGVGVFILRENNFLLMRRKGSHGAGSWGLPGGSIEYGETLSQASQRECFEELGIEISAHDLRVGPASNDIFEHKHFVGIFLSAHLTDDQIPIIMEPHKADDLDWFTFDSLPDPLFMPLKLFLKQDIRPHFTQLDIDPRT